MYKYIAILLRFTRRYGIKVGGGRSHSTTKDKIHVRKIMETYSYANGDGADNIVGNGTGVEEMALALK